ncbi:metallophosphoesterase [Desulfurococcus mucosus]|uniref:Phosphoesterase n=1 Tax=Desulfurococcus mucosus (strain ATCC 35584 / DSM 2162 / JCM 9187 / O7/1) TaxID=765177 RepID=E8R9L7_DESM0|nr:metallophosphoesterase [Desulfurococcus mucosus]ADV65193.1 phosphodiesterase, MJ0936 family [Desulfurococcus mucosus DSM 2162]
MLIGVLSDTHDNVSATRSIVERMVEQGVELAIHLGDVVSPFTLRFMRDSARGLKFIILKGNNDGDVHLLSRISASYGWDYYSEPVFLEIGGRRMLALHGYGDIAATNKMVDALARSLDVDMVLYGHTHVARAEFLEGKLVFNPGEACGYITGRRSYGIVDTDTMKAKIVEAD